jgi:hypothetical protein
MTESKEDNSVRVALITAAAAVLVAAIGYWGIARQSKPDKPDSAFTGYSVRVKDAKSLKPIVSATVNLAEDQKAPHLYYADSDGIVYARLARDSKTVSLEVMATGYQSQTRNGLTAHTGSQDFMLETLPSPPVQKPQSHPRPSRKEQTHSASPAVFDARLVGTWINLTPRLDSIQRIELAQVGQSLDAHLWFTCPGGDCDVGTYPVTGSGAAPFFEYKGNGARRLGTLKLHSPNVLLLAMDTSTATGHHLHHNWVMVNSTLSENMRAAFRYYFGASEHKAFAMSSGGVGWGYKYRADSVDRAGKAAIEVCRKYGARGCRVLLVDDDPK